MDNTKKELIEKIIEEQIEETIKDDIVEDDLIEEDLLEEEYVEEDDQEDEVTLRDLNNNTTDEFDANKYLQENYSFAELDDMSLEEFIEKELEKPRVRELKEMIDSKSHIKGFPTFEEVMLYKKTHGGLFIIVVGLDFEQEVFGIPVEIYLCRTIKDEDHVEMLEANPEAETDLEFMKKFLLSKAIIFPHIRMEDVPKLKVGVIDILLPAVMKHSRYNPNHKIIRL